MLLDKNGAEERLLYALLAPLGMLFSGFYAEIGKPIQSEYFCAPDGLERKIFDKGYGEWFWFTDELYESLPKTFTFAPRPIDVNMEMDYFARSFGLSKHHFIWSDNVESIPREHFAALLSKKNDMFHGRYTFTPWLPQIERLGRLEFVTNDFRHYVADEEDSDAIFGKL